MLCQPDGIKAPASERRLIVNLSTPQPFALSAKFGERERPGEGESESAGGVDVERTENKIERETGLHAPINGT